MTFNKNSALMLASLALIGTASFAATSYATDIVPQTIVPIRVDVAKLSSGYRASKIIGTSVTNHDNDTIGKIDDLIVDPDDNKSAFVIVSVGGFLGMGTHLIAIPYDALRITDNKIMLPGATKEQLKALPEFKYSTK